jgi:hypothetical protein
LLENIKRLNIGSEYLFNSPDPSGRRDVKNKNEDAQSEEDKA